MSKLLLCALALAATTASAAIPASQRDALITLHDTTGGPAWTDRSGWLGAPGTECSWFGVRCDEAQTTVVQVLLDQNNLRGPLPASLGLLPDLKVLSLLGNHLEGPIPAPLLGLSALETLNLNANSLSGELPREIGNLKALRQLSLGHNRFSGTIPIEIGSLANLTTLELVGNDLTGPVPADIGRLSELQWLDLSANRLTGTIPESLRDLRQLQAFYLGDNELSGEIPWWIGELTALTTIYFPGNEFTGVIPPSIGQLTNLQSLYLGDNRLVGSIPREIGNLSQLAYLSLESNEIGGSIPPELFQLTELVEIRLNDMALGGTLPPAIGNLRKANVLLLDDNQIEGAIPAEIGDLESLLYLSLGANRLTGSIPAEIAKLDKLLELELYANALTGPIPAAIAGMAALEDAGSDFSFNMLVAADAATLAFVNRKQYDGDFEASQTVTPSNVRVAQQTDRSVTIEWDLIRYTNDPGGYQVTATTEAGALVTVATTRSKHVDSITVRGLDASTAYRFTVSAVTHPHDFQKNLLVSEPSGAVAATTSARVVAPPDVVVTEATTGLVQIDGTPSNEDGFTLTNFGDLPTAITLRQEGTFFTVEPQSFTLAAGASRRVVVKSIPQPAGSYYGTIIPEGEGVGDDVLISATLLSAARPAGTVFAEPLSTRIETAGAPGSDSVGQARFRNRGTAPLSGIVLSDQPWVVPATEAITIHPGEVGTVNFTVIRSRRPPDAEGALTANLSLVYVDGSSGASARGPVLHNGTTGVSVALVSIVDTPKPPVTPSSVPGVASGEVAWFAPGLSSFSRSFGRFFSDVALLNSGTSRSISDLRLYFTPVGGSSSVASLSTIAPAQAVRLANVVSNVYGADSAVGSLQFRTGAWQNIAPTAMLIAANERGTHTGEVPVFRSDRSIVSGQQSYLTGLRKGNDLSSNIFLQETGGAPANTTVVLLDAHGQTLLTHNVGLGPFAMVELIDFASPQSVTAVVRNDDGSSGRVAAYARVADGVSGDTWSIVDWSQIQGFATTEAVRIPFVDGTPRRPAGRRRAVPHGDAPRHRTDLTIFNAGSSEQRARIVVHESSGRAFEREVVVPARNTLVVDDAGAGAQSSVANIVVTPLEDEPLVVSARSHRTVAGTQGTSVPVLAATAGLRLGQSQRFPALADSTLLTVAAERPGTFRTTLGLVETSGHEVTVRARLFLDAGRDLASSVIYRDFTLGAGRQILAENLVRSIVGEGREALGELHGIQLQVEVTSGRGSVVPFVIVTDNGTGDTVLRLE